MAGCFSPRSNAPHIDGVFFSGKAVREFCVLGGHRPALGPAPCVGGLAPSDCSRASRGGFRSACSTTVETCPNYPVPWVLRPSQFSCPAESLSMTASPPSGSLSMRAPALVPAGLFGAVDRVSDLPPTTSAAGGTTPCECRGAPACVEVGFWRASWAIPSFATALASLRAWRL